MRLCMLIAQFAPALAFAFSGGITNSSTCASCHTGGTNPVVQLTADSTCMTVGTSTTVHVAVSNPNGGGAGLDLRITSGAASLSIGGADSAGTQLVNSEIVQTTRKGAGASGFTVFSAILFAG